ncbi:Pycsar system effector family protein [Mitsuaria sp. 7]|uniref:Pycsar system effector family protein n=1 Tax=Mitsuaria sp. 7 TaxID=1658665 RepID=UPI0012FC733F|nr:Pycsar system effector family protein [Mitsuaria sp. 7]
MNSKERLSTAQWVFERQLAWISAADAKVAVVVTIDLAMLGAIGALISSADWAAWKAAHNYWPIALAVLATVPLGAALMYLAAAVLPKTDGPKDSLLFFGRIANLPRSDYVERLMKASDDDLLRDWGDQIHRNAEVACGKFSNVQSGMRASFIAIMFWVPAIIALLNKA